MTKAVTACFIFLLCLSIVLATEGSLETRKLHQNLVSYGAKPDSSHMPLQLCEGDCDTGKLLFFHVTTFEQVLTPRLYVGSSFLDADCASGLVCYQKGRNQPVPGCNGIDHSRTDFCVHESYAGNRSGGANGTYVLSVNVASGNSAVSATEKNVDKVSASEIKQNQSSAFMHVVNMRILALAIATNCLLGFL